MASTKQSHRHITNMPILGTASVEHARAINLASDKTKILILPALNREFESGDDQPDTKPSILPGLNSIFNVTCKRPKSAMEGILPVLKKANYIDHIIIGLDAANREQYEKVRQLIQKAKLPQTVHILWNDGPQIQQWREDLASETYNDRPLAPTKKGKGRNVWGCAGYAKALMEQEGIDPSNAIVAMHDADIVTYSEFMVARLFQPMCLKTAEGDDFNYDYAKGYYARYTDEKLNARVTRLFGPPLMDSLARTLQDNAEYNRSGLRELVHYFRSFNYMFSGEMAFSGRLLNEVELPNDYSLEIRLLEQVYKLTKASGRLVADVEIAEKYDHHHQGMDSLEEMTTQISAALFDIANEKINLTQTIIDTLTSKYLDRAVPLAQKFHATALMNNLTTNLQKEQETVELFAKSLPKAFERMNEGLERPSHSWNSISQHRPNATTTLLSAVNKDQGIIQPYKEQSAPEQIKTAISQIGRSWILGQK